MASKSKRKWTILDSVVWLVVGAVIWWAWRGFWGGDMFAIRLEGGILGRTFPLATKIGMPLAFLGGLLIWFLYKSNKIPRAAVLFVALFAVFMSVAGYLVVAHYYYGAALDRDLTEYHPYLQLAPHGIELRPAANADSLQRIFCLGGSTTEWGDKEGRGWPQRVEDRLRGEVPGEVQVYNCGRMWYTSLHLLIHYETNVRPLKPDVLVVMEAVNDLLNNADFSYLSGRQYSPDYGHFYGPVARMVQKKPLFQTVKALAKSTWNAPPRDSIVTSTFPGLESFTRNLRIIIELAKLDSTKVVLLTQPYLTRSDVTAEEFLRLTMLNFEAIGPTERWALSTALEGHRQYNDAIRRLASETGVHLIDLEKMVPKTLEYFTDDVHYTTRGYDVVGDSVAFYLKSAGVLTE